MIEIISTELSPFVHSKRILQTAMSSYLSNAVTDRAHH